MLPFLAAALLAARQGASQQPPSLKAASLESHEGMTITVRPWTDPALYKEKFPKNSPFAAGIIAIQVVLDRKSTRLNSSHQIISYAVFCLKKKKLKTHHQHAR